LQARRFYEHFGGEVLAERGDVHEGTILIELAYGWLGVRELDRRLGTYQSSQPNDQLRRAYADEIDLPTNMNVS
jgi:hypothetical protein